MVMMVNVLMIMTIKTMMITVTSYLSAGASITVAPSDTTVVVNTTIFLSCQASRQPAADMAYVWTFNSHLIDTSLPDYALVS